jgi:hypothetical protein
MPGTPQYSKATPNLMQVAIARFDLSKDKTGKVAFTLPKGAIPNLGSQVNVTTAFNGTTPTVTIGHAANAAIAAGPASLFASVDVAPAAVGVKGINGAATLNAGALNVPLAADTDITFTVGGGGANTAGVVVLSLLFSYPILLTDLV